jgi:hypothetical protein
MLRDPKMDIVRVQDVGLRSDDDGDILAWAADNGRIVVTHDRATMPMFAYERLASGQRMPGVFVLNDRLPVAVAIQELLLMNQCSDPPEWDGLVVFLPI